jgi:hypothetical protein
LARNWALFRALIGVVHRSFSMSYALFCNDAKLSKAYPTEADVWKLARKSGLVIDVATDEHKPTPHPVLDNDYEIRPCQPEPHEDPVQNKADAEHEAQHELQLIF